MTKKRHHYVPRTYLRAFCNERDKIFVFRKDDPSAEICQSPENFGFHKYYYSQIDSEGKRNNALEDQFGELETIWPDLVHRIRRRESINNEVDVGRIFAFTALQRVRVPSARDLVELARAEDVKQTMRAMERAGKLPPMPKGYEKLLDKVVVSIDPHQSLLAMPQMFEAIGEFMSSLGFEVLRNNTSMPFLTSDNPVIWFDPMVSERNLQPYGVRPDSLAVLFFPIAPDLAIYGHTNFRQKFAVSGFSFREITDLLRVRHLNGLVCRFAGQAVFSRDEDLRDFAAQFAHESPVLKISKLPTAGRSTVHFSQVFGRRLKKPKWEENPN